MGNPHVLVIPYPTQGHVIPLAELSQSLVKHGFKITFVNSEFNHERVMNALAKKVDGSIRLVSIADGMEDGESKKHLGKLTEAIRQVMPGGLKEFIKKTNRSEDDKITCVLADINMGVQKLIDDGLIDENASPFLIKANSRNWFWGLELSNRPFLWVVKPDISKGINDYYPKGFQERVTNQGRMVSWEPQHRVLVHPSIACFISHCGWNSTVEGVSNGVPFLCWPYSGDQFINENYVCDIWKVGLKFTRDERGMVTRQEIKNKVEQLLGNENFKGRALTLKEMTRNSVKEGGSSNRIFNNFTEWIKSLT
ncbi:UDP-Glycosyltransferase superfamily protein, putative [Theobroma cacao]|uniref:UDP-Glycosyltransferase superfamily protein, putative n=1 Tax=Theobroma cacao TaxID=3641 RepID=A0A061EG78_THECC|nr:UDP-Glycosyltransferase superfamily protein, putative [Theobroma cacao]